MNKTVTLSDAYDVMAEVIESGGEVIFETAGISMLPLLRNRQDRVVLSKLISEPQKNDVIFYQRDDGNYVLHRIVAVKNGEYVLRGDNQWELEHGITKKHIIAVAIAFERNNKTIKCTDLKYRLYCLMLPLIRLTKRIYRAFRARLKSEKKV